MSASAADTNAAGSATIAIAIPTETASVVANAPIDSGVSTAASR